MGIAEAGDLGEQLKGLLSGKSAVTIDGAQLERIDTAVLQLLAAFVRDAHDRGIPVKWKGPSDAARRSMELLGMTEALGVVSDDKS